jgi:hypothetical protein
MPRERPPTQSTHNAIIGTKVAVKMFALVASMGKG